MNTLINSSCTSDFTQISNNTQSYIALRLRLIVANRFLLCNDFSDYTNAIINYNKLIIWYRQDFFIHFHTENLVNFQSNLVNSSHEKLPV